MERGERAIARAEKARLGREKKIVIGGKCEVPRVSIWSRCGFKESKELLLLIFESIRTS